MPSRRKPYKPVRPGDKFIQEGQRGLQKRRVRQGDRPPAIAPAPPFSVDPVRHAPPREVPRYPVVGPLPPLPNQPVVPTVAATEYDHKVKEWEAKRAAPGAQAPGPPSRAATPLVHPFLSSAPPTGAHSDRPLYEEGNESPGAVTDSAATGATPFDSSLGGQPLCPLAGMPCIGVRCQWFDMDDICAILALRKHLKTLTQIPAALEVLEVQIQHLRDP